MFENPRSGRRPAYKYDRTDVLLLGGGALFVLVGVALALGAWLDSARKPVETAIKPAAEVRPRAFVPPTTKPDTTSATKVPAGITAPVVAAPPPTRDSAATVRPSPAPKAAPTPVIPGPTPSVQPSPAPTAPTDTIAASTPQTVAASAATKLPAVPQPAAGQYLVQVGSFGQQQNADRFAAEVRTQGYTVTVQGAGALYRVLVGGFASRPEDSAARDSLARALHITPKIFPK